MSIGDDALAALQAGAAGAAKGAAIGSIIPGLGTAIGGAAGGLIGVALDLAPGLFGADDAAKAKAAAVVQSVTGALTAPEARAALIDPAVADDAREQLAQIVATHEENMRQAQSDDLKAELSDVVNARMHDVEVRTQSGGHNVRADVMLGCAIVGVIALLAVAMIFHIDGNSALFGLISGVVGLLSGCFKDAFGFEYGSSRGSADKSVTIADLARTTVPASLLPKPAEIVSADK